MPKIQNGHLTNVWIVLFLYTQWQKTKFQVLKCYICALNQTYDVLRHNFVFSRYHLIKVEADTSKDYPATDGSFISFIHHSVTQLSCFQMPEGIGFSGKTDYGTDGQLP